MLKILSFSFYHFFSSSNTFLNNNFNSSDNDNNATTFKSEFEFVDFKTSAENSNNFNEKMKNIKKSESFKMQTKRVQNLKQ